MNAALAIALLLTSTTAWSFWQRQRRLQREAFIRHFAFPRGVFSKVIERHPHLSQKDMELVSRGLRQFFMAYHRSGYMQVSMPSQVADDLWHEFILYTRHYQAFCQQAFGRFLHHTPAIALQGRQQQANAGLRRCWRYACMEDNINPRKPSRLPLLFALDSKFHIANGFVYIADCHGLRREGEGHEAGTTVYCAGDFSDGSIDGSTSGMDDSSDTGTSHGHHGSDGDHGSSGDGGSDGGASSCGGSSCGGGCGGD